MDADYASGTFFGQQVVYGVRGLLEGLRGLDPQRRVALSRVTATFFRPLFLDVDYTAALTRSAPDSVQLDISAGSSKKLGARLWTRPWPPGTVSEAMADVDAGRATPAEFDIASADGATSEGHYGIAIGAMGDLLAHLGVNPATIAPLHLATLCWASYVVGMELPGRQALFYSLDISFHGDKDLSRAAFDYTSHVKAVDRRMNMLTIESTLTAAGSPFATANMAVLVRPPSRAYDLLRFQQLIGCKDCLANKVTFVSGSGRGLGSLVAIGAALWGSDVVLHFNRNKVRAEKIRDYIEQLGRRCLVLQGDIHQPMTWTRVRDAIASNFGRLDIFVNNAWPPILPLTLDELSDDTMNTHIFENIRASILAYQALLPALRDSRGAALNISSRYVDDTPRDFAHYAAAKSAIEGLGRGLSASAPTVRFVSARLPKIQTDQTNVPVDVTPATSPFGVVQRLLEAVSEPGSGYCVVGDFPAHPG